MLKMPILYISLVRALLVQNLIDAFSVRVLLMSAVWEVYDSPPFWLLQDDLVFSHTIIATQHDRFHPQFMQNVLRL